jgi:hypothetical protein
MTVLTTMVSELYDALRAAGVTDDIARQAARSVLAIEDKSQLATKADLAELKTAIAQLETRLTTKILTVMISMTAIFGAISAALRFVRP